MSDQPKLYVHERTGGGYVVKYANGDTSEWTMSAEAIKLHLHSLRSQAVELEAILTWLGEEETR